MTNDNEDGGDAKETREKLKIEKIQFERYQSVLELVIDEEERLPLWMLMTKEEKLDMLAHECIDDEAQIMSFLIEFEYGAENNFKKEREKLHLDELLENALNQMVYQKYQLYTRLQAAFYARQFTLDMIKKTQERSIELYNYAEYLYDLNEWLIQKEKENEEKISKEKQENQLAEKELLELAQQAIKRQVREENKSSKEKYDKEKDALAIKFFFDYEKKDEQAIHGMQYQSVQR